MASIVSVDNIRATGTSTNAITIDSSNVVGEMNIASEGGSASTSLQQGLCKVWINFDNSGGNSTNDSFNVSSRDDNAVGDSTVNITNNMNNDDYAITYMAGGSHASSDASNRMAHCVTDSPGIATTGYRFSLRANNSGADAAEDVNANMTLVMGDLA